MASQTKDGPYRHSTIRDLDLVFLVVRTCFGDCLFGKLVSLGKFGSVIRAIRDDEPRVRFLGYNSIIQTFCVQGYNCGNCRSAYITRSWDN